MNNLEIEAGKNTPYISVDYEQGHIVIKGISHPENVMDFYEPVFKGIKTFNERATEHITTDFMLNYFNTSSARCMFLILKELKSLQMAGKNITVNWYHSAADEDMLETGEDYAALIDIDINFIERED
jgi:hypothetical protein